MKIALALALVSVTPFAQVRVPTEVRAAESAVARTVFTGRVLTPGGLPARGAVVVSSAGGETVTGADGSFALAVDVPLAAELVEVTAVLDRGAALGTSTASARVLPAALAPTTSVGTLQLVQSPTCAPRWVRTFGGIPGTDDDVRALAVFDDALYAGGEFTRAGSVAADFIARWDGIGWTPLVGGALDGPVDALAVFDDGGGPALYAGGEFTSADGNPASHIARWDGSSWSALGAGLDGAVHSLFVFDDGGGPALYVGGSFTQAGGNPANRIARWDGATWTTLGSGFSGGATPPSIHAMVVFDDGGGPALYAAGAFTQANGFAANRIAKWNGASWVGVGGGLTGAGAGVHVDALAVFDDGSGPALHVGGTFSSAGGVTARNIAKWDGSTWQSVGGVPLFEHGPVLALTVFDDGGGPALFAGGGTFNFAGGATGIARWDGASWTGVGGGVGGSVKVVNALTVFDDGDGLALIAGGGFTLAGTVPASRIAEWDGAWSTLGKGHELGGLDSLDAVRVRALAVFDDGRGPALYAGGDFVAAGPIRANDIARWNGSRWEGLDTGMSSSVHVLAALDDGSGPALYAGGVFSFAGTVEANGIARWDGTGWSALGDGMSSTVRALALYDDGSGPALYAAGSFVIADAAIANRIAKWDGKSWSALGQGLNAVVYALAVFDDGSGPALYAGGSFSTAGGVPANRIARWDGSSWSAVGGGVDLGGSVLALDSFDDGNGLALYVGGSFTLAGGAPISRIARWDGTSWTSLGSGVNDAVQALTTFDDGSGPALYAGGLFTVVDGVAMNRIARWDGASWSALASGVDDAVHALAAFDGGNGSGLYVGGEFELSPAGDRRLAQWACASRVRAAHW